MTRCNFGDIVVVRFPFADQLGFKQRPAVVISSEHYHMTRPDCILMAVTSRIPVSPDADDVMIQDWKAAGLLKASLLKPVIFTAENVLIRKKLGMLSLKDQQAMRACIARVLG